MKFLRERFEQLCKSLGLDPDLYVNDAFEESFDSLLRQAAQSELEDAQKQSAVSFTEDFQSRYIEEFIRNVEIEAAILLDRLAIAVAEPEDREIKPVKPGGMISFSKPRVNTAAQQLFEQHINQIWDRVESFRQYPGEQTAEAIQDAVHYVGMVIANNSEQIQGVLQKFIENDHYNKQLDRLWDALAELVRLLDAEKVNSEKQSDYLELVKELKTYISQVYDKKINANKLLRDMEGLEEDLQGMGMTNEKAESYVAEMRELFEDIKSVRRDIHRKNKDVELQLKRIAQDITIGSKLPEVQAIEILQNMQLNDLSLADLNVLNDFFIKHKESFDDETNANMLALLAITKDEFLRKESLDSLEQIMRILNIKNVGTILAMGKDELAHRIQQTMMLRDVKRRLGIKEGKFRAGDLNVEGDQQEFMTNLMPVVIFYAMVHVSDDVGSFGAFCRQLGFTGLDPAMSKVQNEVARILEWDFFVHHEQYAGYFARYMEINGLEPAIIEQVAKPASVEGEKPESSREFSARVSEKSKPALSYNLSIFRFLKFPTLSTIRNLIRPIKPSYEAKAKDLPQAKATAQIETGSPPKSKKPGLWT